MSKVIWVAEIGSMHNGDLSLAYELIRQAKLSGAEIAKFQLGWTKEAQLKYAGNYDERRYIDDWADQIAEWCYLLDIEFMASIWSLEGLEVARSVNMKRYKIAHQMDDVGLEEAIRSDGPPVFHSGRDILTTHEYPTSVLPDITAPDVFDRWRGYFGYSSHMAGIGDALIAVAHGAKYIEKHFSLDRNGDWPRDRSFALLPSEFKTMVEVGNEMAALL